MRSDLTDITLVVDRSGSMAACQAEAEGGINAFIAEQQKQPGEALFTLVQFDTSYEFLHRGTPISNVTHYTLEPRGMTALLDAVGRAVNETGQRLDKTPEADRPGCVVFVIVTDGHENSSHEFSCTKVREMIEHQRQRYNWKFTFLGADASAFDDAAQIGILTAQVAQYSPKMSSHAYHAVGQSVSCLRAATAKGQSGDLGYSDQQRKSMI
jgi:uncharacterized protein YegL